MDASSVSDLLEWSGEAGSVAGWCVLQEHSVTRLVWLNLAVLGILAALPDPAFGCRYNVREIGFVDVGVEPYRLFVYVPQAVGTGEIDDLKDTLAAASVDTNLRCEPVPAGVDANHPAWRFLSAHGIDSYPAAVMVSPDGPSRRLLLPADVPSLTEAACLSLEAVLDSPTRRQILEKAADSYGVVLLIEGPQQDVIIRGDAYRLEQLLTNLIDNAVKYTEQGGITVSFGSSQNIAVVKVADTGIGIPREHLGRIFERFYAVDKSRSRKLGGTGLGLSIVKHVVTLHKGTISVTSRPYGGTTFTITLPLAAGSPHREATG